MCFHKRKTPACIITIMSIIMALGGVVLLIESIVFEKKGSLVTTDLGEYTPSIAFFRNATFIAILIASLVAIVLGVLGSLCLCKFCKKYSCCLSIGYGTTLFFVWIVFYHRRSNPDRFRFPTTRTSTAAVQGRRRQ